MNIKDEVKRLNIDEKLKQILFFENAAQNSIEWGMNYILFSPSKKVRPLLVLQANQIYSQLDHDSYLLAACVELIHTYSLVHDDLPCMDNDSLRRGIKTLHVIRDESFALLVGDSLLTYAFGLLANYTRKDQLSTVIQLMAEHAGLNGMIKGQFLDMEAEGRKPDLEEINRINRYKTSSLIQLSLLLGAVNGGAGQNDLNQMRDIGLLIGFIFQLQDDILDILGDEKELGKKVGSDKKNLKSSVPLVLGLDKAYELLNDYKMQALKLIEQFPANQDFFIHFIEYLVNRIQ